MKTMLLLYLLEQRQRMIVHLPYSFCTSWDTTFLHVCCYQETLKKKIRYKNPESMTVILHTLKTTNDHTLHVYFQK